MTRFDRDARPNKDAEAGVNAEGTTITPIEAVISDKSSRKLHESAELSQQILDERRKRAGAPLHMDGLKPLPPEMRGRALPSGVIPGGPDAMGMVPSMRRTIPEPYKPNRIDWDNKHHGKTWAYIPAAGIRVDDIVVDFGKIEAAQEVVQYEVVAGIRAATGTEVRLRNIMGDTREFDPSEQVRVFRKHEEAAD